MGFPLGIGIWAIVHDNRGAMNDLDEPHDASWDRNSYFAINLVNA